MNTGLFIVIEGIDGSGKTTIKKMLEEFLISQGANVVSVREPGGTVIGEKIRELLMNNQLSSMSQTLLFYVARNELIQNVIIPSLEVGALVLADRFYHSTIAYQAFGKGLKLAIVNQLTKWIVGDCEPHLVIYLDVSPEIAKERNQRVNWYDEQTIDEFNKVKNGYEYILNNNDNIRIVNADNDIEIVFEDVLDVLRGEGFING